MILTVAVPPEGEPVSLVEAKEYLRINHAGEDELITRLIAGARAQLERASGLAFVERTIDLTFHALPTQICARGIALALSPAQRLLSVTHLSADGTSEDVSARFMLRDGRLCLRPWASTPVLAGDDRLELRLEVGFGPPARVPEDLKLAVKRLMGEAYRVREEGGPADVPDDVLRTLSTYIGARV